MPRQRLPATLDRIRALLDAAAVHRVFIPLEMPAYRPAEIAEALQVPIASVAVAVLADAGGDRFAAILPGEARVDLARLADSIGARRVRLSGRGAGHGEDPAALPAIVTGLPTVMDRSLVGRHYLYGTTGDPSWVVRLEPAALHRATGAIVAAISRERPASRAVSRDRVEQRAEAVDGDLDGIP
jgi:prolyl-tRNA editing enzyme YbaK/EbsC (Cys-tRNA(Pro) deacylase)